MYGTTCKTPFFWENAVAEFLKLPNPTEYTGHCFQRSSASLAADADVDLTSLKRLGAWKSSSATESYIEESTEKKKGCRMLMGEKKTQPSSNIISVTTEATATTSKEINTIPSGSGISFEVTVSKVLKIVHFILILGNKHLIIMDDFINLTYKPNNLFILYLLD